MNKRRAWLPYEEARAFARGLHLSNLKAWWEYSRMKQRPKNIPCNPDDIYKDRGWTSWGDWLGTGRKRKHFSPRECLPYEEGKIAVHSLHLLERRA